MKNSQSIELAHENLVDHIATAKIAINGQNTDLARFSLLSANELRKLYVKETLITSDESSSYKMIIVNLGEHIGIHFDVNPS